MTFTLQAEKQSVPKYDANRASQFPNTWKAKILLFPSGLHATHSFVLTVTAIFRPSSPLFVMLLKYLLSSISQANLAYVHNII